MNEINKDVKDQRRLEETQNWSRVNLLEVRGRDKLIEYLKNREHEARIRVREDTIRKRQLDIERRLQEFDRDINLKRILRSDRRYLSIGRDRAKPKFLDTVTMARISRDVAKIRAQSQRQASASAGTGLKPPAIDPSLFEDGRLTCSKFWNEENRRRRFSLGSDDDSPGVNNTYNGVTKRTKLPVIVGFKKSDNSDCLNRYLDLHQYVPVANKSKPNKEYSVINTRISLVRPKYL